MVWRSLFLFCLMIGVVSSGALASSFDPGTATETYLATVSGEARARSDAYFEGGYWLLLWDALYAVMVSLVLLFTRASSGIRSISEKLVPWRWLQTFIYAASFVLVTAAMTYPLTAYEGFYREHQFGLSNMTLEEWNDQYITALATNVVISGIVLSGIYAVIRRTGSQWWIWGTAVTTLFLAIGMAIGPVLIAPLFNDYKPMRDGELKQEILSLARATGVPAEQVYEFDASRQSKRISANVSGFLGTTRISLNDNLLNRSTPAEVKAVMAHEIGHYALGHVYEMIVSFGVVTAVSFMLANVGFAVLHSAFGAWWGVRDISDPAGFPILMIVLSMLGLVFTPITNTIIRTNEAEADIFGLNAAREPDGFATTALKLSEYRKLDPSPLEEVIFFDHPSGRSRIAMAMRWKAENFTDDAQKSAPDVVPSDPKLVPGVSPSDQPN